MNLSPPRSLNESPKEVNRRHFFNQGILSNSDARYLNISDDDFSDEERHSQPSVETGNFNKWTNMLNGWQERYFVLKDGVLSYYRSEEDIHQGCRGAIRLKNAQVQPHPYDDCRIDVCFAQSEELDWNEFSRCVLVIPRGISAVSQLSCVATGSPVSNSIE